MTGIAALLLVALAIRPAPQVVERIVERIVTVPAAPQESAAADAHGRLEPESEMPSPAVVAALPDWLAWALFTQPTVGAEHDPSYPELRKQALLHALESRELPVSRSAAMGRAQEGPVLHREPLDRWLEEEGIESVLRRLYPSSLRNPSGARS